MNKIEIENVYDTVSSEIYNVRYMVARIVRSVFHDWNVLPESTNFRTNRRANG